MPEPAMFDEKYYLRYDIATKKYEPLEKYQHYKFFAIGFNEEDPSTKPDDLIEVTDPGNSGVN